MNDLSCFILSRFEYRGELPLEIIPQHWFQRASEEQVRVIKEMLGRMFELFSTPHHAYEHEVGEDTIENGNKTRRSSPLPREQWRYWVITTPGTNADMSDLSGAAGLLKHELDFGFLFRRYDEGHGWQMGSELGFFSRPWDMFEEMPVLSAGELKEINPYFQRLQAIKTEWPVLYSTARRFRALKALPNDSDFLFVGYFSILESLITHCPQLSEPLDSITHQVRTKINLLEKMFVRKLDYSLFGEADREKIWSKLYAYRSNIAHGEIPDFKKTLRLLRTSEVALSFLREAVKLTVIHALHNPQFVADLKRC